MSMPLQDAGFPTCLCCFELLMAFHVIMHPKALRWGQVWQKKGQRSGQGQGRVFAWATGLALGQGASWNGIAMPRRGLSGVFWITMGSPTGRGRWRSNRSMASAARANQRGSNPGELAATRRAT
jgi:hypothetical protein